MADVQDEIIEEAKDKKLALIDEIESLLKKSESMCKQLKIEMPQYTRSEPLNLTNEKEILEKKIKEHEELLQCRLQEIRRLKKQQKDLCDRLGEPYKDVNEDPLPSPEEISAIVKYVEYLEDEKYKREEKYITVKSNIVELAELLQYKPTIKLEKLILSTDDNMFSITETMMKELDAFHKKLTTMLEDVTVECGELRKKVRLLWSTLDENLYKCENFLKNHSGNTLASLEVLRAEIRWCEDIKKANMWKFIERLKLEIEEYLVKCRYGEEDKKEFCSFSNDMYQEDLLEIHEIKLEKLKGYFLENK